MGGRIYIIIIIILVVVVLLLLLDIIATIIRPALRMERYRA